MRPLSATIITLNEERNIGACLASLDFVDEIVVVDSGSSDRTEAICCSNPKVRFFRQEWLGYGGQKNRAAAYASHDWVLNIDADERVSPELRTTIMAAMDHQGAAFRMARENYFGGCRIRHCGWYPDYTTRLYDRRQCAFSERAVHESLSSKNPPATLAGNLIHYTYENISDYLKRMDTYSSLAAREIAGAGIKPGMMSLLIRPLFTFAKMYVVKRGVLDGYMGLLLSVLYAQYTFCKYAKARELLKDL